MEFTVVLLVDEDGNQAQGADLDAAQEAWDNEIGGAWHRRVDIVLNAHVAPTVVNVTVPAAKEPIVTVS